MTTTYLTITAVYCAVCAIFIRNLYTARKQIAELKQESRFLKTENHRLERKEPSTIEALAALQAKCRRQDINECSQDCKDPVLKRFCVKCLIGVPEDIHKAYDKAFCKEAGNEIEAKTKEYMEVHS